MNGVKGEDNVNLIYLSQDAIDDIKTNFSKYKKHFKDAQNDWFINCFKKHDWLHESKIQCDDFSLNMDKDYNVSDRKNIEIVYEKLHNLSPTLASDERLWAGMAFCQFWDFVKYRRKAEIESGNERDILNSFLFMRGRKRSCLVNCLSRLWWTGYLLYDLTSTDHYKAIDLITERAYSSNIVLFGSSNFVSNKNLALGVLDCIQQRKKAGDKIGRYHFVEANKYINCIGGVSLLDVMTREEARNLANRRLNQLYGTIDLDYKKESESI